MLTGTYIYGMDRKGRVVMPSNFRQALGAPFVLTRAPGPALLALSSPQWGMLLDRYERSALFRGIGRAVQVIKRARWDETVQRGEFPSLGQLDLDIEVPRLEESQPFRQRVVRPLGLPLVEAKGRLDGRALRRLAGTLVRLLEESP